MKKLTLKDATKEELIQYFFSPECVGGGYRIQADKERFLIWLEQKRAGELMDAQEANYDASQKALEEYILYIRYANTEKDLGKKLEIFSRADEAYRRYETINKRIESIEKKLKKMGE